MPDDLDDFLLFRAPTAERPLLGLTVLVVEDSLYASEAMRLLCLRSGARIRRADSLRAAYRHLATYRPMVVIVDLSLPDGSGLSLIRELSTVSPRIPVILAISGDTSATAQAQRAGANGFLAKPVQSLAAFQTEILRHLPRSRQPNRLRVLGNETVTPDPIALRDDLIHVADLLEVATRDEASLAYASNFLWGLARAAQDEELADAAMRLELASRNRAGDGDGGDGGGGGGNRADIADIAAVAEILSRRIGPSRAAFG